MADETTPTTEEEGNENPTAESTEEPTPELTPEPTKAEQRPPRKQRVQKKSEPEQTSGDPLDEPCDMPNHKGHTKRNCRTRMREQGLCFECGRDMNDHADSCSKRRAPKSKPEPKPKAGSGGGGDDPPRPSRTSTAGNGGNGKRGGGNGNGGNDDGGTTQLQQIALAISSLVNIAGADQRAPESRQSRRELEDLQQSVEDIGSRLDSMMRQILLNRRQQDEYQKAIGRYTDIDELGRQDDARMRRRGQDELTRLERIADFAQRYTPGGGTTSNSGPQFEADFMSLIRDLTVQRQDEASAQGESDAVKIAKLESEAGFRDAHYEAQAGTQRAQAEAENGRLRDRLGDVTGMADLRVDNVRAVEGLRRENLVAANNAELTNVRQHGDFNLHLEQQGRQFDNALNARDLQTEVDRANRADTAKATAEADANSARKGRFGWILTAAISAVALIVLVTALLTASSVDSSAAQAPSPAPVVQQVQAPASSLMHCSVRNSLCPVDTSICTVPCQ